MTVQHRTTVTGWVAVLTLAVASSAAGASSPRPSGDVARHRTGEVVRDWNDIARSQPFGNPLRLARILAIMHAAQHDAVNGAQPRYQTYVSTLHDLGADAEAAAAAAAHEVLVAFFPANQPDARRSARRVAVDRSRRSRRRRRRGTRSRRRGPDPRRAR